MAFDSAARAAGSEGKIRLFTMRMELPVLIWRSAAAFM
jgi:hypothetical protein